MIMLLQVATYGLATFVFVATLAAIVFARRPLLGVAQHWGLQLWWLALLGLVVAPIGGTWPAAIACLCCALYWSLRIFHRRAAPPPAAPLLRLVSANVAHFNPDHDRVLTALAACDADVIALVEVTGACRDRLRQLDATHPHAVDSCDLSEKYGVLVRARWPLTVLSRGGGRDAAPRHVSVRLQMPAATLDLMAIHLTNPIRRSHTHRIPRELAEVIAHARQASPDLVLCGDCNAAGWSSWLRQLESATSLRNTRRLLPSWPVRLPPFLRLPIDHVWARGRAAVLGTRLGPETGSDHFPLLAEIGWRDE